MKTTYSGSCHCEKVQFEVDAEIDAVRVCNCSICSKRGALIYRVKSDCFRLKTPLTDLSLYEWNTKTAKDYFCPVCGILPFRRPRSLTEDEVARGMTPFTGWAINVRCLKGINISTLKVIEINGQELP